MAQQEKSVPEVVAELKDLTVAYAKQETVEPVKALGRYVGFGIASSLLLALGAGLIGLGLLRFLQTELTVANSGSLSFLPYVGLLVYLVVLIVICALTASRSARTAKGGAR